MRTSKISIANREYEVRVWTEGNSTFVQCFEKDVPATLRFSVSNEAETNLLSYQAKNAVEQLVRIAVGDLISAAQNRQA
jgi:hypothetical protein